MYCCCGKKINCDQFECLCDWEGWVSTCDFPDERKNKDIPMGLPKKDGNYLTRCCHCGDRYEEEREFSLIPRIEKGGYFGSDQTFELHWEGETWEEGTPYAWKEIEN